MITPYYPLPYRLKIQILVQKYRWERCFALEKNPEVFVIFPKLSFTLRNCITLILLVINAVFYLAKLILNVKNSNNVGKHSKKNTQVCANKP